MGMKIKETFNVFPSHSFCKLMLNRIISDHQAWEFMKVTEVSIPLHSMGFSLPWIFGKSGLLGLLFPAMFSKPVGSRKNSSSSLQTLISGAGHESLDCCGICRSKGLAIIP